MRWFVHIGHQFVTTSSTSPALRPSLGWQSPAGYDGQYYFAVAADPRHARDYIGGNSGIVYSRILYPALARATAAGSATAVTYSMLVINLLAVCGGTVALALWLRSRGAPTWPAAVFGIFPGLVFTVVRDLTEPLAFGLVAAAMLVFDARRPRRVWWSCALFALALLTRETVAPFALGAAAALAVPPSGRQGLRRAALFVVGCAAPLVVWRVIVSAWLHQSTQEVGGAGWGVPFHGLFGYRPFDPQHRLIVLTVVLPALALAALAAPLLARRDARLPAAVLLANVLLYVVFLPKGVYVDYGAAGRAAIGVLLAAVYCVPSWRKVQWRPPRASLALAVFLPWTIVWYLLVARHYGLDGMDLISS